MNIKNGILSITLVLLCSSLPTSPVLAEAPMISFAESQYTQEQIRQANRKLVIKFFQSFPKKDRDGFLALWAEDAKMIMPFAPPGLESTINGKNALRKFWSIVFREMGPVRFVNMNIILAEDPNVATVTHQGQITLEDGSIYNNTYITLLRFKDGRVQEYHEYYDPSAVSSAWGGEEGLRKVFGEVWR